MAKKKTNNRKTSRSRRDPLPPVIKVKIGQIWDPKLGRMRKMTEQEAARFEPVLERSMKETNR